MVHLAQYQAADGIARIVAPLATRNDGDPPLFKASNKVTDKKDFR
jgi:L-aminopeptidase/D-esterase-like protein